MAPDLNSLRPSASTSPTPTPDATTTPINSTRGGKQAPPPPSAGTGTAKQPNILFIMADQLTAPLLKMYNPDSQIKTPNLDALAAKSVQFDSAYCPSPLCAPSRMSLITGQLPSKIASYDNAAPLAADVPTFAHYLRAANYETALSGKMHFVGEQLHGYEKRLTSDIYPGDFGWVVDWDRPGTRLEWYHNASSVVQAGVCVRSNQLDYDEEVMYRSTQYMYDYVREKEEGRRPFCLTVSLTHPHDPYAIEQEYWDRYEGVDIEMPKVTIPKESQDPHSKRLMKVCDLWDLDLSEEQVKAARRAYYGACSYVDDCVGRLLDVLKKCRLDEETIVIFSGDHGDMLGERDLWYKMCYFENSVRVPMLIYHPHEFNAHRVKANVSTLDLLPTLCDLVGTKPAPGLPMDGVSMLPHLEGANTDSVDEVNNTVFAEYMGEGTVSPLMMIKRGSWKYITCPADPPMFFNLDKDPLELDNLAARLGKKQAAAGGLVDEDEKKAWALFEKFEEEARGRWDMEAITEKVLTSQRNRRVIWGALVKGEYTSWDFNPADDGRLKYIRSNIPLDDLERRARYPPVDTYGKETTFGVASPQAGAHGE